MSDADVSVCGRALLSTYRQSAVAGGRACERAPAGVVILLYNESYGRSYLGFHLECACVRARVRVALRGG